MRDIYSVTTGRHETVEQQGIGERTRVLWRELLAVAVRTRRAPPPVEDSIDLLVYGVLVLAFALATSG